MQGRGPLSLKELKLYQISKLQQNISQPKDAIVAGSRVSAICRCGAIMLVKATGLNEAKSAAATNRPLASPGDIWGYCGFRV